MSLFGGYSFGTDESIEAYLTNNQVGFIDMVISHNLLLASYKREDKQAEVIRIAQRQAYPRIGMILSSAKDNDNTFLFADDTNSIASIYLNVINLMTSPDSPFAEGLADIAARYTAAILIGYININSDIRNVDMSNHIEEEATRDLERIIELIRVTDSAIVQESVSNTQEETPSDTSFYFALGIDKTTFPESYFDTGFADEAVIINEVFPNAQVLQLSSLTIPKGFISFGYVYFSSLENSSSTIPLSIQETFLVNTGDDTFDIINKISQIINQNTIGLQTGDLIKSNILAAPDKGELVTETTNIAKNRLYAIQNNPFDNKIAQFNINRRVTQIDFKPRRQDPTVNYELIILGFYTAAVELVAREQVNNNYTWTYQGDWEAGFYNQGDIVFYEGFHYGCTITSTNNIPTNFNDWTVLLPDKTSLLPLVDEATNGIEGLLYGTSNRYLDLDEKGPSSRTIVVNENRLTSANSVTPGGDPEEQEFIANTFYFRTLAPVTGELKVRISSTNLADKIEILPLLDGDGNLVIPLLNDEAEDVALKFLKAIYSISQSTEVLGVLAYPNAVQMTSFKESEEEIREVIDILEVPPGLLIATGTPSFVKTDYFNNPRSVVIPITKIRVTGSSGTPTPEEQLIASLDGEAGTLDSKTARLSPRLQGTFDSIKDFRSYYGGY